MNTWYELTPIDTLFFRGNEPMEAGQPTSAALFPPPVSVIQGALRTALLKEKGIAFSDYKQGKVSTDIVSLIGKCGEEAPFAITAVLVKFRDAFYTPAPAHWFVDLPEKPLAGSGYGGKKVISASAPDEAACGLGLVTSSGRVSLVVSRHEAVPLTGCWVNIRLLAQQDVTFADNDILTEGELYSVENRIGIELNNMRTVVEGRLYSGNHIRLREGVTIVVAVDKNPGLAGTGLLQLGGEQRKCRYEQLNTAPLSDTVSTAKNFIALAPVAADDALLPRVIAAHKPVIIAGWDLSRSFHKPSATWLPAGSVFSEKINNACIPITL